MRKDISSYLSDGGYNAEKTMMMGVEISKPSQVIKNFFNRKRLDNGSTEVRILEINNRSFSIERVQLRFSKSNSVPRADGKKQTDYIPFYLSVEEALVLKGDILNGVLIREAMKVQKEYLAKGNAAKSQDAILPSYLIQSGTTLPDGQVIFREINFSILKSGYKVLITATSGPGKKTDTGGYVAAGKSNQSVSLVMSPKDLKMFAHCIGFIEYYITAQYARLGQEQQFRISILPLFEEIKTIAKAVGVIVKDIALGKAKVKVQNDQLFTAPTVVPEAVTDAPLAEVTVNDEQVGNTDVISEFPDDSELPFNAADDDEISPMTLDISPDELPF